MRRQGKLMSVWWFFVIVIIAVAVISATVMFYNSGFDTRELEAKIMATRALACITHNISLADCFSTVTMQASNYYIAILDENNVVIEELGKRAFLQECEIQRKVIARRYAKCYSTRLYLKNRLIRVLTASNENGNRI